LYIILIISRIEFNFVLVIGKLYLLQLTKQTKEDLL